ARPDPADIDEDRAAEVEDLAERPAEVGAVLGRHDHAPAAGETVTVVAAHAQVAAECELVGRTREPAAGPGRAQQQRVTIERLRSPVERQLSIHEDVPPLARRGGAEGETTVDAEPPGGQH